MIDREELERLHKEATPGPWCGYSEPDVGLPYSLFAGVPWETGFRPVEPMTAVEVDITVYLRNAVPDILELLTERDTLAAENTALAEKAERLERALADGKQSLEVAIYGLPKMLERMSAALKGDEQ